MKNLIKELFTSFMRSRRLARYFKRLALFETFTTTHISREVPHNLARNLLDASRSDLDTLLARLGSHPDGLTEQQADEIRERVGLNETDHEQPLSLGRQVWLAYANPFNILLSLLAVISWLTEDIKATIVISTMVLVATIIRVWQEGKSGRAADKLKAMVSTTATVIRRDSNADATHQFEKAHGVHPIARPDRRVEVPISQLVPGDMIALAAGDMIPADCRLVTAKDLFVSQAAMTGESLPVEKFVEQSSPSRINPLELDNILFMGTNVISGSAGALVLTTGSSTYFGTLSERVTATDREPTQFQSGVNRVSWLLIRFMLVMAPLVLLINGFAKGDWLEAFLFALSIAVGLTPEMLPMIVTSTLAKGAVVLSRKKVIVKRLDAIQNFGAMDILCTDKTGTITQDKIVLERYTDVFGNDSDDVLELAYLNSYYQTGLKNLLDVAVLEHAELQRELDIAKSYRKVDEIPFDFQRRRMSVVVSEREDHHELICKGAVEEILSVCSMVRRDDTDDLALTDELLAEIRQITAELNEEGLRVVAVAVKDLPPHKEVYSLQDEAGLTLVGYVAFLDPPKESAAPAIRVLAENGVRVKVLTGDNELVTAKVCRTVGLACSEVVQGGQLDSLSDQELSELVEQRDLFARLTPAHKERIVKTLKQNGHVVGFMGDGINDAAALRGADIGISVDTAVDIAKEAADIILLEKSLLVLEEGVLEGRKTFANMLKYLKMTASSNFGNVFSVLVASAFLPFLPMLPMHLLVQNLLYDFSQIAIPFDNVDEELLKKPQTWNPAEIGRFMLYFGPISSLFDIITYLVMWFAFGANRPEAQTLFQSGWFIEGLLTQSLVVHMIRTSKIPFLQSRPSGPLLAMTVCIIALGIFIPMGPLAQYFKLQSLPPLYFVWLSGILLGYMLLTQSLKGIYVKKYGWQ